MTSEPSKHTFGSIRIVIQEQTVHKMTKLVEKMYESNLVGRTRSQSHKVKGYQATFEEFLDATRS